LFTLFYFLLNSPTPLGGELVSSSPFLFSKEEKGGSMKKLLIVCFMLLFPSIAMAAEKNLIELHKSAGKLSNKECLACHAKIKTDVLLNQKFKTLHRLHLESNLDTPKNCSDCHQSIDLREGSAASLRKQVDPQLCAGCHSGGVKGAKVLFAK
jgi:NAD-dependent SIR2 family protein deacetylase